MICNTFTAEERERMKAFVKEHEKELDKRIEELTEKLKAKERDSK